MGLPYKDVMPFDRPLALVYALTLPGTRPAPQRCRQRGLSVWLKRTAALRLQLDLGGRWSRSHGTLLYPAPSSRSAAAQFRRGQRAGQGSGSRCEKSKCFNCSVHAGSCGAACGPGGSDFTEIPVGCESLHASSDLVASGVHRGGHRGGVQHEQQGVFCPSGAAIGRLAGRAGHEALRGGRAGREPPVVKRCGGVSEGGGLRWLGMEGLCASQFSASPPQAKLRASTDADDGIQHEPTKGSRSHSSRCSQS